MVSNKGKEPFNKSIEHLQELFGIGQRDAIDRVQGTYSNFKNRNQKLTERQNNQSNSAQVQLISHFALLASLTLTVLGFTLTQNALKLTDSQQLIILIILGLQIGSLCFGAADYLQTIKFHNSWAKLYNNIEKEVDSKFENGELQWTNDLNEIEAKYLKKSVESTRLWITNMMVIFCLLGLVLLLVLYWAVFYDLPLIH